MDLVARLVALNAAYARAIDNERFEDWPDFFLDPCLYKVTTVENLARGYDAGIIYADSRGMLQDRVSALRQANIYERQRYRHIVGLPAVLAEESGEARVETPFLVVRIMRTGAMDVFATGRYLDRVPIEAAPALRFRERLVVCDTGRFDTLVALPL
jgi:3-phenylpropionate/cinnamic acid dioxygenase small subunit